MLVKFKCASVSFLMPLRLQKTTQLGTHASGHVLHSQHVVSCGLALATTPHRHMERIEELRDRCLLNKSCLEAKVGHCNSTKCCSLVYPM